MTRLSKREEFIYLVASDDVPNLSKIGWTVDVDQRLSVLQIGSPVPLRVVGFWHGDRELEHWLHLNFATRSARGEWFTFRSADRGYDLVNDAITRYNHGDREFDYMRQPKLSPQMKKRFAALRAERVLTSG